MMTIRNTNIDVTSMEVITTYCIILSKLKAGPFCVVQARVLRLMTSYPESRWWKYVEVNVKLDDTVSR